MAIDSRKATYLALVVVLKTNVVKVIEDLLGRNVLLDLAGGVETDHVGDVELARDLEGLLESLLLDELLALVGKSDDEVNGSIGVVLFVVLRGSTRWRQPGANN